MAGHYIHAEKYQISSWLLGCIEKEIGDHVIAERERIIKLLEERYAENVDHCEWGTHLFLDNAIELIKGEDDE